MDLHDIPIDRLERHPMNSNVMPRELLAKLVEHIGQTDRYPPVIVRELTAKTTPEQHDKSALTPALSQGEREPNRPGPHDHSALTPALSQGEREKRQRYQILDGHHRVEALRQLKRASARCVVWEVTDEEALLLLATLNRLQGRDDPHKRAALVAELAGLRCVDAGELADLLPERTEELESLLSLRSPPPAPRPPQALCDMPVAVHFFLKPAQREELERALRAIGGGREAALMRLVASRAI